MGIFSHKKKDELVLVFDIGSSSVGACFFLVRENKVPNIIHSTRESIVVLENLTIDEFLKNTLKALKIVVARMCLKGIGKPDRVFCVLSSPWFHSEHRIIKYSQDEDFVFTDKLVNGLIDKEVSSLIEKYNQNSQPENVVPIEMKTMNVLLNDYEVDKPHDKQAKNLTLNIMFSLTEKDFLDKVEEEIQKHFIYKNIKFSSFLVSSFVVARDMFTNYDKFLLINIGGEVTELSLIKNKIIKSNLSMPIGCNFAMRTLAKELNVSIKEAYNYFLLYKDSHASHVFEQKVEDVFLKLKNEWLKQFQESINNLSTDISLPSVVFITVDQALVSFFSEIIKEDKLNQLLLTEDKFKIVFLTEEALSHIVNFENNSKKDSFLIINSVYINNFLK